MRTNLKLFRVRLKLTQAQIAEKIGVRRSTYAAIENGDRDGSMRFWNGLKTAFELSDSEYVELMKRDEE